VTRRLGSPIVELTDDDCIVEELESLEAVELPVEFVVVTDVVDNVIVLLSAVCEVVLVVVD
jgi:hypothetical protein